MRIKEIVEIQHLDGDIEEFDVDGWAELDLELTEEPEGWSGSKAEKDAEEDEEDDEDWDEDEDDEDDDDEDLDDETRRTARNIERPRARLEPVSDARSQPCRSGCFALLNRDQLRAQGARQRAHLAARHPVLAAPVDQRAHSGEHRRGARQRRFAGLHPLQHLLDVERALRHLDSPGRAPASAANRASRHAETCCRGCASAARRCGSAGSWRRRSPAPAPPGQNSTWST